MDLKTFQRLLRETKIGKPLPTALYVHETAVKELGSQLLELVEKSRALVEKAGHPLEGANLIKLDRRSLRLAFLSYPGFFDDPHPVLHRSLSLDLGKGTVRATDYSGRKNRPILHRKETMLAPGHERIPEYEALTQAEESEGLYENTKTIGFEENWKQLLQQKGLQYVGHQLLQVEAPDSDDPSPPDEQEGCSTRSVDRWKTALSRTELSRPVKTLLQTGLLTKRTSFFDYGCGLGSDAEGLRELGHQAQGWDPAYAPDEPKKKAQIVNLGFVLNVIEDPAERVETLVGAWSLTEKVLIVTTLIAGQETYTEVERFGDGVLTSLNTFQKHFTQEELQTLIEDTTEMEAVPAGLGMFLVFRNLEDQEGYLAKRSSRVVNWEEINRRLRTLGRKPSKKALYAGNKDLLDGFWAACLGLGRAPVDETEFENYQEVRTLAGSIPKAMDFFLGEPQNQAALHKAMTLRREDVLVYLASGEFKKMRAPLAKLPASLRRDVRTFFGDYPAACDEARDLLFNAGDSDILEEAVGELDFGWIDEAEGHFSFHSNLLDRLPPVLRVYIDCGARLFGNPREADVIKIHLFSQKLTFLHYDDFDGEPFPQLVTRIKIDLRTVFVTVFDHTLLDEHQIVFFKERFVGKEHPGLGRMIGVSKRLRGLGVREADLGPNERNAPSQEAFMAARKRLGLTKTLSPNRSSTRSSTE